MNSSDTELSYLISGNPVTDNSFLQYDLKDNAHIRLSLIDMNGKVQTIEDQFKSKGSYTVYLNPEDYKLASGVYLLSMTMDGTKVIQEKIVVNN